MIINRITLAILALVLAVQLPGCGGGSSSAPVSTASGGPPPPPPPPIAVAGLWKGLGCCVKLDPFPVIGITDDAGNDRFMLLGTHYVGQARSTQTAYATCASCLAGPAVSDKNGFGFEAAVGGISASASIVSTGLVSSQSQAWHFTVPYDPSFAHASSSAAIQGVYTTNLGTGYTLTITIDASGHLTGNDTNACSLDGQVSTSHPTVDLYDVALDASTCGSTDGHFAGSAALIFDNAGNATQLFLSVSNPAAAIGWVLDR